jgi:ATP-dependent Lon protease
MLEQDIPSTIPSNSSNLFPLLPLRDVVVFPHMVIPLFVGRSKSIKALETAMEAGKSIALVAQKSATKDDPGTEDLYAIGSMANILQMLKLPDGTVKVLVEGTQRANVLRVYDAKTHFDAEVQIVPAEDGTDSAVRSVCETEQKDSPGDTDFAGRDR